MGENSGVGKEVLQELARTFRRFAPLRTKVFAPFRSARSPSTELEAPPIQHDTPPRAKLPQPDWLHVENWGADLTISYGWASWRLVPVALFCIVVNGLFYFWHFTTGRAQFWPFALLSSAVSLTHFAAGLWLIYQLMSGLVNVTVVQISGGELTVRHGPLPPWNGHALPTQRIVQLYCSYYGTPNAFTSTARTLDTLSLYAVLDDGHHVELLRGLHPREMAGYLEQTLEAKMKIADQRVAGEIDWTV